MNRTGCSICFVSAMLYASNAFAIFISTQDDFLLSEDFTLTVPFRTTTTTDSVVFDESGNGWDILVGVQLRTVNDIFTDLRYFGELSHDVGGVVDAFSTINSPITDGVTGDSTNIWSPGITELIRPHIGTEDIYEYTLSITSVDRSVMGQLSMDANLMLSGRHVEQIVVNIPEPSALGLLCTGLLGLGFIRRRRQMS